MRGDSAVRHSGSGNVPLLVSPPVPASRAARRNRPDCPWREFAADKHVCDYCGGRLPKYHRNWCDLECALSYAYNHQWVLAKQCVWQRESGACCHCGQFVLRGVSDFWHPEWPQFERDPGVWGRGDAIKAFYDAHSMALGEVDHIVPCGGNYNSGCHNHTDNLRLLCRGCHRSRDQWSLDSIVMPLVIPGHPAAAWSYRLPQSSL